jgi:hypothetical protein
LSISARKDGRIALFSSRVTPGVTLPVTPRVDHVGMPRKDPDARREYSREYQRIWYRKNRELHLERVLRVTRRQREFTKQFVDRAKQRPCLDCGVCYPPYVMDFDHVRGVKTAVLSRLRTARGSWSKLVAEIEKCEVVCSNCHRIRTRLRKDGFELEPSQVVQRLGPNYVSVLVYS